MSDRELVMRWVRAWAHTRGLRVEDVDGWPLVHVRGPSRDTEIVCVDPGRAAFEQLARHTAHDPREMLTVFGRDLSAYHDPPLPPGLRVDRDDEIFMTTTLAPSQMPIRTGTPPAGTSMTPAPPTLSTTERASPPRGWSACSAPTRCSTVWRRHRHIADEASAAT